MSGNARSSGDKELLMDLCRKHGVNPAVVEELFKIEREYQFRDRRHGVYERLRECIRTSIKGNINGQ